MDVVGALHVVATLLAYLSLVLMPAAVAIGYGEQVWPFLAAQGDHRRDCRGGRATPGRAPARCEGFLVVALTWLAAAAFAALPYVPFGDQLDRPVDAFFEGMLRLFDHGR